jgi:site-specific DNA recombinase
MDRLDDLVTTQLIDRLLAPERLSAILQALSARRAEKSVAVDDRIKGSEMRAQEADDRLRRLYKLVEDGMAKMNDMLKERLTALKANSRRHGRHWTAPLVPIARRSRYLMSRSTPSVS